LRGTIPAGKTKGTHLLALQQAETNLVLAQIPVPEKKNEISAAPALLANVDLEEKIVSGDAMHTQQELSRQIVEQGGDYLLIVKKNQKTLYEQIQKGLTTEAKSRTDLDVAEHHDKGHGRIEYRRLTTSAELAQQLDWPFVGQAFELHRERTDCRTEKVTQQIVYGITSLPSLEADAERLQGLTRLHWSIENGLHYRRDVTFHEDACRLKSAVAAEVMAIFNNLSIGLLRRFWDNVASARRYCETHLDFTLSLVQTPPL
jgi:predicted transposase YbfD/YdcC